MTHHFRPCHWHVCFLASLALALAAALRPCHAEGWEEVRVAGPFVVRAEFPMAGFDQLLGELARLQTDLARAIGLQSPREPIELYLFQSEQTYRDYVRRHHPSTPAHYRAIFLKDDGRCKVMVYRHRQFAIDVRHECTHALLHATLPMVPLWLDEGLARYFELPSDQRVWDSPHLKSVKWAVRFGMVASVDVLERETDAANLSREDYRDSWAWVHFMLHGSSEARHELVQFLADIQENSPPGYLSGRLARRIPDLRSEMARHFASWKRSNP